MPPPDVKPSANGADVDIIFRVEERRTGNINFGASLGQGTGVGGFLGLEEPNLFGRGKRGKLQWQFGKNINDFTLSYTDPAIRESRISGTLSLFDSRARYTVGELGRRKQTGGSFSWASPSWVLAIPGCSPHTRCRTFGMRVALPISSSSLVARWDAPNPASVPAWCGIPGLAFLSPRPES